VAAARPTSLCLVLPHRLAVEHHRCLAPQTTTPPAHRVAAVSLAALEATQADQTRLGAAHRALPRASPVVSSAEVKLQPAHRQHQHSAAGLEEPLDGRRKAIHQNQPEDCLAIQDQLQAALRHRLHPRLASHLRVSMLVHSRGTTTPNTTHRFDANSHSRSKQDVIPPFHYSRWRPSRKQHLRPEQPGERRCPIRRFFVRSTEQPGGRLNLVHVRREASHYIFVFYT
jgi:hypothetical protein